MNNNTEISDDIFVRVTELDKDFRNNSDKRFVELENSFREQYGVEPEFFVKVPGRVNIIGEHIDYCGFPVLPMAIEQNILLAVSSSTDHLIHLRNVNKKYSNFKCDLNSLKIDIPKTGGPEWFSYYLCGVKGILDEIDNLDEFQQNGMLIMVSGNIPPASGLSSSSALVSSATLATAFLYDIPLNPQNLATISAKCERYIGTEGGGMDQAIAFLAKTGCAQFIHFHPELKAESIKLPKNPIFVVANSLAEMNKAATSDFNERVVECRLACRLLAKKLNFMNWRDIQKFVILQNCLDCNLNELEEFAKQELYKDIYTRNDILNEFNLKDEIQFENEFLTSNTKHMKFFKLRQRTLHVIQESIRVWKFRATSETDGENNLKSLSNLMEQSHTSLRTLYECSHPSLDKLVEISNRMGIGARLTGAGWGGCIVALCDSIDTCNEYIKELKEKYYKNLPQAKDRNLDDVIFATCPHGGAEILFFNNK